MELKVLTKQEWEQLRQQRNRDLSIWRTSYLLTEEMQSDSYDKFISNRQSLNRYWGVHHEISEITGDVFIGVVGLCNMSLENRNAELSMMLNMDYNKKGYGTEALLRLLDKGFNEVNLENIYGEAYTCSSTIGFWKKIIDKIEIYNTELLAKKYWKGIYYPSLWFNFTKKDFKEYMRCLK